MAGDAPDNLSLEQRSYLIQLTHPEKIWPALDEAAIAPLFGVDVGAYSRIRAGFAERAAEAAVALLDDPGFAACVDRLPFAPGATVVGLGDSITDDYQSWLEILRHVLARRRGRDAIEVVNAGVSGDTTAQMLSRFVDVVHRRPDWIICLAGTNDARTHGWAPVKPVVSPEETAKNLHALRAFADRETGTRWVWMTPPPVLEARIVEHWYLAPFELGWRNRDLRAIADCLRAMPEPVVDLRGAFGEPPDPGLLLADGLHPSLAGQKAIVKALITELAG